MPNWTKDQELAINETGKNIIVSAGAGSGKTAVLTERVIRKLKSGVSIKNMLILTFTNNAAHEMKERIRKSIKREAQNNIELKKELDYIDNAYITTFDSFSLSIVKKYHYLLNIGNDISIIDSSIIDLKKEEILNDIFENKYSSNDFNFFKIIDLLCVKDDKNLKELILDINKKLDLLEDKNEYLNNYIDKYYDNNFIESIFNDYVRLLINKINTIDKLMNDLTNEVDGKYIESFYNILNPLLNSNNYDSIRSNCNVSLGTLRNATDLGKELKLEISNTLKELNKMTYYTKDELINNLLSTKDYVKAIIDIIKELDKKINDYKKSINKYEFNDISIMAINVVKNNNDIRLELRDSFNEICVDEYQDTSDLQESFINLISNNNVYMVGDIKQSIYRFRNANPILFKNKYNKYSNNDDGMKIDLVKNFRSREEVLDDINVIFNLIMDDYIGGAEYSDSHNMVFGNTLYNTNGKTNQNNNLEIYNYEYDKEIGFKKDEIEAFIIAKDIKDKIDNKYQIYDKDTDIKRDILYKDFVILMDRSTNFDLYKKILEYMNIPTTIYKDEDIVNENELLIIKNLINLIIKIKKHEYDIDFKYSFISIARSYLSDYNDDEIFDIFSNNTYKDTDIYNKCLKISNNLDNINNKSLLSLIIDEFDLYNNFIKVGNVQNKITILEYLYGIFGDLDSIGYGIYDLNDYLENIIGKEKSIKVNMSVDTNTTVKIMTIHKSKGLEYPICYFSGFDKPFNLSDLKSRIIFDNKYGIVVPIDNEGLEDVITKDVIKNNYINDDISERIRLLYVALTRVKEKMIIVGNFINNNKYSLELNGVIDNRIRKKYKSFKDIILSIKTRIDKYFVNIDLNTINLTHDYNKVREYNYENSINKTDEKIIVTKNNVEKIKVINKHFSKENHDIIDEFTKNNMNLGTYLHELFEVIDFKNPNYNNLNSEEVMYINNFLNQELLKNIKNATIYKEYEFIYQDNNELLHGIIDLMLEYDDNIDIIDYKLMNTINPEYINQLNGYKKYIENNFNKSVSIYLYSILNNEFTEL